MQRTPTLQSTNRTDPPSRHPPPHLTMAQRAEHLRRRLEVLELLEFLFLPFSTRHFIVASAARRTQIPLGGTTVRALAVRARKTVSYGEGG